MDAIPSFCCEQEERFCPNLFFIVKRDDVQLVRSTVCSIQGH